MLLQIIYTSRAIVPPAWTTPDILQDCARNNLRDGITGLLLCDGSRFLQALEGRAPTLKRCYERIEADRRHDSIDLIRQRPVRARQFGSWSMAYREVGSQAGSRVYLSELRSNLAEVTDDAMLALFIGFAALSGLR